LRVFGTQRLRVIDSSIHPEIVISNTQASALMIGEKGADLILKYWKGRERVNPSPINAYGGWNSASSIIPQILAANQWNSQNASQGYTPALTSSLHSGSLQYLYNLYKK